MHFFTSPYHSSFLYIVRNVCAVLYMAGCSACAAFNQFPSVLHILHAFSLFPLHLLNGLMFLAFTLTMFLCCGDDMFHFSSSVICVFSVFCFTPVLCFLFLTFITSTSLSCRVFVSIPFFCISNCVCFFNHFGLFLDLWLCTFFLLFFRNRTREF